MAHICDAIVVTCMDFRLQKFIEDWVNQQVGEKQYDRVAWAGGVLDWDNVMKQIDTSKRLHQIKKVLLINHEDCGGYGAAGTPQKHREDLLKAKNQVNQKYSDLTVQTYYLHLDGTFEEIK